MQYNFQQIQSLFERALAYDQAGDAYNAVKLYKKVVKLAPDWSVPYHFLSLFYKQRNEWKPSFHYSQKAIEYNPEDKTAWQILATAATALRRWRVARTAWNELGFDFRKADQELNLNLGLVPVCINPKSRPEIIWAKKIDPARAIIESIPQPSSGRRYHEEILFDNKPIAHRAFNGKRVPVYEELEKIHFSSYRTYAVILQTGETESIHVLDKLCNAAEIGFDNWSMATRQFWLRNQNLLPEFYGQEIFKEKENKRDYHLVALAAKNSADVHQVLHDWKIITLQSYRDLVRF